MERHRARQDNPIPVIYANFGKCKIFALSAGDFQICFSEKSFLAFRQSKVRDSKPACKCSSSRKSNRNWDSNWRNLQTAIFRNWIRRTKPMLINGTRSKPGNRNRKCKIFSHWCPTKNSSNPSFDLANGRILESEIVQQIFLEAKNEPEIPSGKCA